MYIYICIIIYIVYIYIYIIIYICIIYYITYIYIHSSLVAHQKKVSRYQAAFDGDVVRLADILEARYPQALVVIFILNMHCVTRAVLVLREVRI
jgi:hypothetical protein